jgi:hypothetical protein
MLLIESEMPVSKASKIMDVYPQRVWNIFDYWISLAFKDDKTVVKRLHFNSPSFLC